MHEMGIALHIVEIASSALPPDEDLQIEAVNIKVGKLTAVIPQSLRFCFNVVTSDTALAGARLQIEEVSVVVHCDECDLETTIEEPPFVCGTCGNGAIDIVAGRELIVTSIEVAEDNEDPAPSDKE